jgi:transposase-like protein
VSAAAAASLDVARVRAQLAQARELLAGARELLAELYDARAWVTLGLDSWQELCARELPELAQLLTLAERRSLVVELRRGGMSLRAAAAPAGVAPNTARKWLDEAGVQLATVTSLDGRQRPATATPAPARPRVAKTDRAVALVADAGADGLTVFDVMRSLRWRQSQASATLHRLAASGRLAYLAPERRGQLGRYVTG